MAWHARLSASQTKDWAHCAGTIALKEFFPVFDPSGDAARLGTCAHALIERCLEEGVPPSSYEGQLIEIVKPDTDDEDVKFLHRNAKMPPPSRIVYEVDVTDASHIVGKWVIGDVERHFGGSVAEFCSRLDWEDRVHSSDRVRVGQEIRQLVDGTTSHITSRFRVRVDGEYRWCLSTASYNPTTCGIRGVLVKIDEQVATEERLVLAQRMEAFGKLAGGVAHDFNNILAVVLSFAEFVRDALPEHDELREDIIEVLNAADRGAGMTRRLLAFARQLPDEKKPVDLNLILTQMHSLLASTLGERIELVIIPSARPAVVLIDPVSFDQILINLAVNARDAMPRGGRLSITLEVSPHANPDQPEQRVARLLVADTGLGMEEGVLARIFEPFSTTKAFGKGTGIGLATCFGIVTAANGSIEVESVIGRGTTFTVTFPLTDQSVHTWDSASRPTTRAAHGERVLVVEDEPILRRVTGRVLENAGYTVHLAADGPEAFRLLDTLGSSLALILTDIVLPGASGYEVADHAARSAPTAIVLLTSGYLDESLRNEHKPLPVLWKPVRPVELIRAVAEALAARRAGKPASVGPRPDDHRAATFASAKTPRPLSSHRIALPRQSPLSLPSFLSCAENASSSSMTMSLWLVGPNASCRAAAMRSSSPAQWTPHATRSTRVSSTPWSPT